MKMIFALLSLFTSSAMAVTMVQQNLNPAASQNEVNGTLDLIFVSAETESGIETNATGASIGAEYFYGLTDTQAIGFGLQALSSKSKSELGNISSTIKTSGLQSILLGYKGNFDLGTPTLFVRGALNLTPDKEKVSIDTSGDKDNNAASGQNALLVQVGLVFPEQAVDWGFSGSYQMNQEGKYSETDDLNDTSDSGKIKHGNKYSLSAFTEFKNDFHPNVDLTYLHMYSSQSVSDNGGTTTSSGSELLTLTGSLRVAVNQYVELLPHVALATMLNKDKLNIDKYNGVLLGLTGRFLF
ncbi:MAG: hypothetical protein J7501_00605 [Bdellovibrio sp.]|nr:hypothetical protein [Bdellovibrio sp.]